MSNCKYCGEPVSKSHKAAPVHSEKEPLNKLMMELAYTGTLFWLPLLVCPKEKDAKYHANQGLWVLIVSVISCNIIRLLSAVTGWMSGGILGFLMTGIYSLVYIAFLALMMYLLWNVWQRAMRIHSSQDPEPILFFDDYRIIK